MEKKNINKELEDEFMRGQITININSDVLSGYSGEVFNLIEFLRFYDCVKVKKTAKIRIIYLTFEGDIIVKNINYDGKKITLTEDYSQVKYNGGDDISVYTGDYIKREENNDRRVTYYLVNVEHGWNFILISFNKCLLYRNA